MTYTFKYNTKDGTEKRIASCVSFVFEKEIFTPYTSLTMVVYDDMPDDITEIKFAVNNEVKHHGFIDSFRVINHNGIKRSIITSRGFTALLTENQLPPGMYTNMTLDKLFSDYITLPNIEHESNNQSSYIYVNKGASIWDSVANLSYKVAGVYPYIYQPNKVMINMPENASIIDCNSEKICYKGTEITTKRMVSHYNMADIMGEYGTYSAESSETLSRNIVRQRHFELDQRFLNDPDKACQFRMMMAERGHKQYFFNFMDYQGQDLNDIASNDEIGNRRISYVRIKGDKNGIFTDIKIYDEFPQVEVNQ